MLVTLGLVALLAGQPAAAVRSPYLDVVGQYGPGTERQAVAALFDLKLTDPDRPAEELNGRLCTALGARACAPDRLASGPDDVRARVHAAWLALYPRALALHVEALAASPIGSAAAGLQRAVLRRLIDRLDAIARAPHSPAPLGGLADTGRHLLVWTLQLQADELGLAETLDAFDAERSRDVELRLARADLEVLRSLPVWLEQALQRRALVTTGQREEMLAQEETRLLERAARAYAAAIALDATLVEAQIRLARVEARLGRLEAAASRLRALPSTADPRHAYLVALFRADIAERQGHRAEAIAHYEAARRAWPGAQTPVVGLARLLTLDGAHVRAREALATLGRRTATAARSDPWHGYDDGQAWRLPAAMEQLHATFTAR